MNLLLRHSVQRIRCHQITLMLLFLRKALQTELIFVLIYTQQNNQ